MAQQKKRDAMLERFGVSISIGGGGRNAGRHRAFVGSELLVILLLCMID